MVDGPEDDVPTMAGRVVEGADADTTAAEVRPPAALEDEEEDKTVQSIAPSEREQKAAPTPRMGPPRPVAARAATLQSALVPPGMPQAPVSAVASTEPDPTPPPTLASAGEDEGEEVTTTAPRISAPKIPLSIPGSVKIRTVDADDDLQDETEVRTLAGEPPPRTPERAPPTRAAAGPAPEPSEEPTQSDVTEDDGPTTQAPAPRVGSRPSLASQTSETAPPSSAAPSDLMRTRPATKSDSNREPPTAPGVEKKDAPEPPTAPGLEKKDGDAYDPEESITSRALAADLPEDSVTQQAPLVPALLAESATGAPALPRLQMSSASDVTGGETTTKKREAPAVPADGEPESITTQAPGNLTNMLRVIAADAETSAHEPEPIEEEDDDALPQNRTAVMPNAPMKDAVVAAGLPSKQPGTLQGFPPPPSPLGGGRLDTRSARAVAAPRLEPESDSGLRVARPASGSGERVSTGQIAHVGEDAAAADPPAHAPIPFAPTPSASLHDVDFASKGGPRYGLIVGIALAVSILVPILLYVALNHGGDEPAFEPATFDAQKTPLGGDARPKGGGKRGIPPPPSSAPH